MANTKKVITVTLMLVCPLDSYTDDVIDSVSETLGEDPSIEGFVIESTDVENMVVYDMPDDGEFAVN